jgi:AraC-like DNA-binding protein
MACNTGLRTIGTEPGDRGSLCSAACWSSRDRHAIHENPGRNWSLEHLAEVACLSRSTFSRQFTEITGIPAMHYLTLWRMHTAPTRLKAGNRDLQCVAREVGYLSAAAFQKAFKRVHGFTPTQAITA